ncbi:unknown [Firmicutes bacterium CAG:449]|nr:unknown [Firmicutes bacterium CAG:449]
MKKKLILLISSFAVLGVIGLQNNQTSDKFTYNTLLKSNEVIGKKFKATKEEFNGEKNLMESLLKVIVHSSLHVLHKLIKQMIQLDLFLL